MSDTETSAVTLTKAGTPSVLEGIVDRPALAHDLSVSQRTLIRYEMAGMPVLRIGKKRLYEIARVREWLLNGGVRPSRRRSAAA